MKRGTGGTALLLVLLAAGCTQGHPSHGVARALATPIAPVMLTARPGTPGRESATPTATPPTATALIDEAVSFITDAAYRPPAAADLYAAAWAGAAFALEQAGVVGLPSPPAYPADPAAAHALHDERFPALEAPEAGKLTTTELSGAALKELARVVGDCHTFYKPPPSRNGGPSVGVTVWNAGKDSGISRVFPGSPAWLAGLRPGQRLQGAVNTDDPSALRFPIQTASGALQTITFPYRPLPLVGSALLPGSIGYLEFDFFPLDTITLLEKLRGALTEFEQQGVTGWILDLRSNDGGYNPTAVASLFVDHGWLYTETLRAEGTTTRYEASGDITLPSQRPLVILVSDKTESSAEIVAGFLQSAGRAKLVGQPTMGCVGDSYVHYLPDGSTVRVGDASVVLGPQGAKPAGGLTPDVTVSGTGVGDAQLDAAIRLLQGQTGSPTK